MRAIAVFQFYFPYVLPRAPDWPEAPISFTFPGWTVSVLPRGLNEELFPQDIDKTLSTMSLSLARVTAPTSAVSITVRDRCHDRVEVQVHGEVGSPEDVTRADTQAGFMGVAILACNAFLEHLPHGQ